MPGEWSTPVILGPSPAESTSQNPQSTWWPNKPLSPIGFKSVNVGTAPQWGSCCGPGAGAWHRPFLGLEERRPHGFSSRAVHFWEQTWLLIIVLGNQCQLGLSPTNSTIRAHLLLLHKNKNISPHGEWTRCTCWKESFNLPQSKHGAKLLLYVALLVKITWRFWRPPSPQQFWPYRFAVGSRSCFYKALTGNCGAGYPRPHCGTGWFCSARIFFPLRDGPGGLAAPA